MNVVELLTSGGVGAIVVAILAYLTRRSEMGKIQAEITTLKAQAEMITAQADDLVSARLIRELDRISQTSDMLDRQVRAQAKEIDRLRRRILNFAAREHNHIMEKNMLKEELTKLYETDSPVLKAILSRFPIIDVIDDDDDPPLVSEIQ